MEVDFKGAFKRPLLVLGSLFVLFLALGLYLWTIYTPSRTEYIRYDIEEGASLKEIASDLGELQVISMPRTFVLMGRLLGYQKEIKRGSYLFPPNLSAYDVLKKLSEGSLELVKVTFPEGLNMWQVSDRLAHSFRQTHAKDWLHAIKNSNLLVETGINLQGTPPSLEGFLFPQTYNFALDATKYDVLRMMIYEFKRRFTPDLVSSGESLGLSPYQIVIMASMVEKESLFNSEQPHIASVFFNRIKRKMRFQSDPTVIYGMWPRYDGNITKRDLQTPTPFNTYTIPGFPIGPIANPGATALYATTHPLKTDDIFFVAKGDGSHFFSSTLAQHNHAIRKYILGKNFEHKVRGTWLEKENRKGRAKSHGKRQHQ